MPSDSTPVYLLADLSSEVIHRFLTAAYAESKRLAPGSPQTLTVIPFQSTSEIAAQIETQNDQKTAETVARKLNPAANVFLILDARSAQDDTALLVKRDTNDDAQTQIQTVRITFSAAQCLVTSLDLVGNISFVEIQSMAGDNGGVYNPAGGPRKQGGPAPRMRLGARRDGEESEDENE